MLAGASGQNIPELPGLDISRPVFWNVNPEDALNILLHEARHDWGYWHEYNQIADTFPDSDLNGTFYHFITILKRTCDDNKSAYRHMLDIVNSRQTSLLAPPDNP
jgi:hypothetical protein